MAIASHLESSVSKWRTLPIEVSIQTGKVYVNGQPVQKEDIPEEYWESWDKEIPRLLKKAAVYRKITIHSTLEELGQYEKELREIENENSK